MRVVAVDASRRRGTVSRSVEAAAQAAEAAGAVVDRVRLYELDVRTCTACGFCHATGECRIPDDLSSLAGLVASADGLILGTPSYFWKANDATRALMERLSRYLSAPRQLSLPGMTDRVRRTAKRAVIITACSAPEPLATFFGYSTGPIRELRRALGSGGIRTVGSLAVTDLWRHPDMCEEERGRAESLGRMLVGKV